MVHPEFKKSFLLQSNKRVMPVDTSAGIIRNDEYNKTFLRSGETKLNYRKIDPRTLSVKPKKVSSNYFKLNTEFTGETERALKEQVYSDGYPKNRSGLEALANKKAILDKRDELEKRILDGENALKKYEGVEGVNARNLSESIKTNVGSLRIELNEHDRLHHERSDMKELIEKIAERMGSETPRGRGTMGGDFNENIINLYETPQSELKDPEKFFNVKLSDKQKKEWADIVKDDKNFDDITRTPKGSVIDKLTNIIAGKNRLELEQRGVPRRLFEEDEDKELGLEELNDKFKEIFDVSDISNLPDGIQRLLSDSLGVFPGDGRPATRTAMVKTMSEIYEFMMETTNINKVIEIGSGGLSSILKILEKSYPTKSGVSFIKIDILRTLLKANEQKREELAIDFIKEITALRGQEFKTEGKDIIKKYKTELDKAD